MKELIVLTIILGLAFFLFIVTLISGLKKKNKKLKLTSLLLFFAFIGLTAWTGFKFVSKTYNKVTETLRPRTGDEIYDALFGKRKTNCIKILNYQDQVIPKIDYAICLHFETCPAEMKRILAKHNFKMEKQATKGWNNTGPLANENWFKPESLGDSVLVFKYSKDDYGNGQTIYSSVDSTRIFCIDILD
jgi:energy-coupling factor transporter transmembrane protein EcfT